MWKEVSENRYVDDSGNVHNCGANICDQYIFEDNLIFCPISARSFTDEDVFGKQEEVRLRTKKRVKRVVNEIFAQEEMQRSLQSFFNEIFKIPSDMSHEHMEKIFKWRLYSRHVTDVHAASKVLRNYEFSTAERDFWVDSTILMYQRVQTKEPIVSFLLTILSYAADLDGFVWKGEQMISPDMKVIMRFPLESEIQQDNNIPCIYLTRGIKIFKQLDWSDHNHICSKFNL